MPDTLTTHRVVMALDFDDDRVAGFIGFQDEDELVATMQLPRDVWEAMGRPSCITMKVKPGDWLNR